MPSVITIVGPVAKSKSIEKYSPIRTEEMETIMDITIIERGEFEKTLAIAGGIIRSDVIRSTPTI